MKKKIKLSSLKKKAWKLFSEYIRRTYANRSGNVKCVTCGAVDHWKNMQAGHFIAGRTNSILFEETCVHPQCRACNIFKGGNYVEYFVYMEERYGREEIDRLRQLKHTSLKLNHADMQAIIDKYSELLKKMD